MDFLVQRFIVRRALIGCVLAEDEYQLIRNDKSLDVPVQTTHDCVFSIVVLVVDGGELTVDNEVLCDQRPQDNACHDQNLDEPGSDRFLLISGDVAICLLFIFDRPLV